MWGEPADRAEAVRVLRRAFELGVNFIDTADSYGPFVSERLIRKAPRPYRDGLVIATKVGLARGGPNDWRPLSKVTVEQVTEARAIVPIASVQNRYSLLDRESEDVLSCCAVEGIAFIP